MKSVLTLALITLLCTCGRAQINPDKLPRDVSNIAFIKGGSGYLIDSITIRTSLDTVPYGFSFTGDSLFFDVSIFSPVDELTLETFARGHSFGRVSCWVDAPSADVHLSVAAGRGVIDSVGLSPMNRWYKGEISKTQISASPEIAKRFLGEAIGKSLDLLIAADFLESYTDLPNLKGNEVNFLYGLLQNEIGPVKKHPRFKPLFAKLRLLFSSLGKMTKYEFTDVAGKIVEVAIPDTDYWVLNIYESTNPTTRRDHAIIRKVMERDSLFNNIPVISISAKEDAGEWAAYLQEGNFPWPHYREVPTKKTDLSEKVGLYPGSTYLLLNEKNKIEGAYDDVVKLAAAIMYRKGASKL